MLSSFSFRSNTVYIFPRGFQDFLCISDSKNYIFLKTPTLAFSISNFVLFVLSKRKIFYKVYLGKKANVNKYWIWVKDIWEFLFLFLGGEFLLVFLYILVAVMFVVIKKIRSYKKAGISIDPWIMEKNLKWQMIPQINAM